jgi:hypothetical protein
LPGGHFLFLSPGRIIRDESAVKMGKERKTLSGRTAYPKPFESRADKVSAHLHLESTPMSNPAQTAQEQHPANLAALRQRLQEMAANTKPPALTMQARPVIVQGPVIVIRGK